MIPNLTYRQLSDLLRSVFALRPTEKALTIFVDLPDNSLPDTTEWQDRRRFALEWYELLLSHRTELPFSHIRLARYPNVGSNNNELPANVSLLEDSTSGPGNTDGYAVSLDQVLNTSSVVLAMTELSATAPLKVLARKFLFRGATLPGFRREMVPALGLDYEKVNERVMEFKRRMDDANGVNIRLRTDEDTYVFFADLRHRTGHASGGLMREPGIVGNLPSGEAYIVPYEGEKHGDESMTIGRLPVQFEDEIVLFEIKQNRATEVLSHGKQSDEQQNKLTDDPAYGNIAEIGIGVLGEWGVKAIGSTLLDEKLGLHVAFGRSEHFGGVTSPSSFRNRKNVVHIDWVYVPSVQPGVSVVEVAFEYPEGKRETIIQDGRYVV